MLGGRLRAGRVGDGQRVLAVALTEDGCRLCGTLHELHLVPADAATPSAWRWADVHAATWDAPTSTLTVHVADPGRGVTAERTVHTFVLRESARLLDLFRERVQASIVLQRSVRLPSGSDVALALRRGVRNGAGTPELHWTVEVSGGTAPGAPIAASDRAFLDDLTQSMVEELGLARTAPPLDLGPA